ncbi:unnamed protein product [Somion occarium]|uniref:Fungal-type protein kinase domain-containing protein n=1 Tax=Somion occarium TaxID=3059160 RepID=A0ABP1DQZ9_9APHY
MRLENLGFRTHFPCHSGCPQTLEEFLGIKARYYEDDMPSDDFENGPDETFIAPEVKENVLKEFGGLIERDFPIVDFIHHVWKCKPEDIPGDGYQIWGFIYARYFRTGYYSKGINSKDETFIQGDRYAGMSFNFMLKGLVLDIQRKMKENPAAAPEKAKMRFAGDLRFLHTRELTKYAPMNPDFIYGCANELPHEPVNWPYAGLLDLSKLKDASFNAPDIVMNNVVDTENGRKRRPSDAMELEEERPAKRRKQVTEPLPSASDLVEDYEMQDPDNEDSAPAVADNSTVAPSAELDHEEIQIALSLAHLLSDGGRAFASGFQVEDTKITLWYGDRSGLIKSKSFDFVQEPHYLLLLAAAIYFANDKDLGMYPLLSPHSTHGLYFNGRTLKVPAARDINDIELGTVHYRVNLPIGGTPPTIAGAVGRGGLILHLTAGQTTKSVAEEDKMVAKIAWQSTARREGNYIRRVHRKMNESEEAKKHLKHIVNLKCSSTLAMNDPELNLPRVFMTGMNSIPKGKTCQLDILVMKEYRPLQHLKSRGELVQVFRGVLAGHRWAWETAGVLHRDVSPGNVMFYRTSDEVVGVLCDWDLAEAQENLEEDDLLSLDYNKLAPVLQNLARDGTSVLSEATLKEIQEGIARQKPRLINGSQPFVSIDLLDHIVPAQSYRHDLESFFWVLVWFCATHNASSLTLKTTKLWTNPRIEELFKEKVDFLCNTTTSHAVLKGCPSTYRRLIQGCLRGLRNTVRRTHIRDAKLKVLRLKRQEAIVEGNAGMDVRYKEEMISVIQQTAGQELTFETFIKCLDSV